MPPKLLTRKGSMMAATLACRPGTLATHRAASALYELRLSQRAWIDVTTPGIKGHRREGIRVHNGTTLTAADVFVINNIPCTTLARTLLDVAEDGRVARSSAHSTTPSSNRFSTCARLRTYSRAPTGAAARSSCALCWQSTASAAR